jgi:hypothetical protein
MSEFIKLNIIHPNNIEGDCEIFVRKNTITQVARATTMDKKHRNECNSLISTIQGNTFGVIDSVDSIMHELNDLPTSPSGDAAS